MYNQSFSQETPGLIQFVSDATIEMNGNIKVVNQYINLAIMDCLMYCLGSGDSIKNKLDIGMYHFNSDAPNQKRSIAEYYKKINEPDFQTFLYEEYKCGDFECPYFIPPPIPSNDSRLLSSLQEAYEDAQLFCTKHPKSFPPILIYIFQDIEGVETAPVKLMEQYKTLHTQNGNALICTIFDFDNPFDIQFPELDQFIGESFVTKVTSAIPSNFITYFREIHSDFFLKAILFYAARDVLNSGFLRDMAKISIEQLLDGDIITSI